MLELQPGDARPAGAEAKLPNAAAADLRIWSKLKRIAGRFDRPVDAINLPAVPGGWILRQPDDQFVARTRFDLLTCLGFVQRYFGHTATP